MSAYDLNQSKESSSDSLVDSEVKVSYGVKR